MATVQILAPLDGWCTPLVEVPDAVFSGGMLGDGLAIDPTSGVVVAPANGVIVTAAATGHAVSLRTDQGIEVLVHVGVDTVHLAGRGFEMLVRPEQQVRAGEALIRFDLDAIARAARSVVTPIVVTRAEGFQILNRHAPGMIRVGDVLFEFVGSVATTAPVHAAAAPVHTALAPTAAIQESTRILKVQLHHGLHARPAALLSQSVRNCAAEVSLAANGRQADARSVVAIMSLGVRYGEELQVTARGVDAGRALDAVVAGLEQALRLESAAERVAVTAAAAQPVKPGSGSILSGVRAAPGFAVGTATRIRRREIQVPEPGRGVGHERAELERARNQVRLQLTHAATGGSSERQQIIAAHVEFLDDPALNEAASGWVAQGKSAGYAWRAAIRNAIRALESLGDQRYRERADDLLDLELRVLQALTGEAGPPTSLPENAVVVAEELMPSELVALDRGRLAAICLGAGGATSHVAILAAAMEVPMLIGLGPGLRDVTEGAIVIVDAEGGSVDTAPSGIAIQQARERMATRRASRETERSEAQRECLTLDGTKIHVFANLGSVGDAALAVSNGAEGCGLLRTEFLFLERDTAPDEGEQLAAYQGIANALAGRPLVLRLMDIGGDKPLKYLPFPAEDNPALGLRGIRAALWRPDLLRTQLRAALRVEPVGVVQLLLPMVTDVAEVRTVRAMIDELRAELGNRAVIEVGAMIETPAAALMAQQIAREVDFLSIGSNDLTQYTLAMDRGHPELARRMDALHPAVFKIIAAAAGAGIAAGKLVAVCGGVAADTAAVPLLIGLGVRELSVVPAAVPALKRQIRALKLQDCEDLARRCLELGTAAEIRALVRALGGGR